VAGLQWISEHPRVDVICIAMGISFASNMSAHAQSAQANRQDLTQTLAKDLREYVQLLRTYQSFSAVAASLGKGAVLIMPAGNDSQPNARVPVTSPISVAQGVISVGAVQQGNSGYQVAFFSNSLPTVCAPGVEILSAHLICSAALSFLLPYFLDRRRPEFADEAGMGATPQMRANAASLRKR